MMLPFKGLTESEVKALQEAIPLITVLIAGADGQIDPQEISWSKKVTEIRAYASPFESLKEMYKDVGRTFEDDLAHLIQSLPNDVGRRQAVITDRLSGVNEVLSKLQDPFLSYQVYKDFTSFARHVAKASGGFLGIGSISRAEARLIDLPMVNPIAKPEEEEE